MESNGTLALGVGERLSERPRVWPALLVLLLGLPLVLVITGTCAVIAAALGGVSLSGDDAAEDLEAWLQAQAGAPLHFFVLVSAQLGFLLLALLPALASRETLRRRLRLNRPRVGAGTIVLCLLGTLGVQSAVNLCATFLVDELSPNLQFVSKMFLEPQGIFAALAIFTLSALPGLCEELFFRGYVQSRLVAAWGGWAGLVLPTLVFALAHFDLQHSFFVLPLGAWLGYVAWRTGSTWTAVLCHAFNNLVAILMARWIDQSGDTAQGIGALGVVVTAVPVVFTLLAVRALSRARPDPAEAVA